MISLPSSSKSPIPIIPPFRTSNTRIPNLKKFYHLIYISHNSKKIWCHSYSLTLSSNNLSSKSTQCNMLMQLVISVVHVNKKYFILDVSVSVVVIVMSMRNVCWKKLIRKIQHMINRYLNVKSVKNLYKYGIYLRSNSNPILTK